jgi:hypothetical protein
LLRRSRASFAVGLRSAACLPGVWSLPSHPSYTACCDARASLYAPFINLSSLGTLRIPINPYAISEIQRREILPYLHFDAPPCWIRCRISQFEHHKCSISRCSHNLLLLMPVSSPL